MSLTSHLSDARSPVRAWFAEHFANTASVAAETNRKMRRGEAACEVKAPDGSERALVGTAVDLLLRATLAPRGVEAAAAIAGASVVDGAALASSSRPPATALAIAAMREVQAMEPWARALSAEEMRVLCMRALALAKLEQCFRAPPPAAALLRPVVAASGGDIEAFVAAVVSPSTVEDLVHLAAAVIEDHEDLRGATPLELNPTFARSRDVGGADADLIAAGLLLELKATATTRIAGRQELWQLAGYTLLDADDRYGIHAVGISALRWRRWVTWPVDALFAELSGGARPLSAWRAEFVEVLDQARSSRRSRRTPQAGEQPPGTRRAQAPRPARPSRLAPRMRRG